MLPKVHPYSVEYLRCYILGDQSDWNKWLPYATFVFNTTPRTSTGFTPHELLFRRKPNIPRILEKETPEIRQLCEGTRARPQSSCETAKSNLQIKKEKNKEYYDKTVNVPVFVVRDKVLLYDESVHRGRSSKLSQCWIGPYEIISLDDVNVTLKLPRNTG
jgi:hypothetical protein